MTMTSPSRLGARKHPHRTATAAIIAGAALALTSCVGPPQGGTSREPATGQADEIVREAQERVEALYAGETFKPPPTEGPLAVRGARVAMVNVGTQAPTGAAVAENAREAAEILDWDLSVFNGEFDPNKYQEGIRQAIASQADVIWLFAIDCPIVRSSLEEAKAAGIPVVSQEGVDCNTLDPSAPSLFTQNLEYVTGRPLDWGRSLGEAQADWIIAKTDGDARIVMFAVTDRTGANAQFEGFVDRIEQCGTCEILQIIENPSSIASETQTEIEQALLRNPDANALSVAYDDLMTGGGAAAVMASGRSDDLLVVAGVGYQANIDLIRNDQGQDAAYALDMGYETWATADLINRFLAGAEIVRSGVGVGLIDREHLPEEGSSWAPPFDYRAAYSEVWQG